MSGHLFIVRGDIRRLACDAWLMPCDRAARPQEKWLLPGRPVPSWPAPTAEFRAGRRRVLAVPDVPDGEPRPWLVNLDAGREAPAEWFLAGVREFLAAATGADGTPVNGRASRLVALPLINNAPEDLRECAGSIVAGLVPMLLEAITTGSFDIALVANDDPAFAAAQAARRDANDSWFDLDDELRDRADDLARKASRGELALFLGAGVSASVGLPVWDELLDLMARRAGMSDGERGDLRALDQLDQAGVIESRLGGPDALRAAVCELFTRDRYGLMHALLASLPVREAVTTNYDQLFELAWEGRGWRPSVVPYALQPGAPAWLLKMHGCVSRPEDVVLTRGDQLAFERQHAALSGVAQTLLLTRYMVFVGFSLTDNTFHRVADAVRRVLRPSTGEKAGPFGTAVVLRRRPLVEDLWGDDLCWVGTGDPDDAENATEAARRLEVFLDRLLAGTRDTSHVLDERYAALLSPAEHEVRTALLGAAASISEDARQTPAWQQAERLLANLGYRADVEIPSRSNGSGRG